MLVKTSLERTNFVLPVKILTKKGYIKKLRYYETEFELYKAYRQLQHINSINIIPLYPVVL